MVLGSGGVCVVENGGQTMAWCFGELHIALDDRFEHKFLEVAFYFVVYLVGQTEATVIHREQETLYFQCRIKFPLYDFDGIEEF